MQLAFKGFFFVLFCFGFFCLAAILDRFMATVGLHSTKLSLRETFNQSMHTHAQNFVTIYTIKKKKKQTESSVLPKRSELRSRVFLQIFVWLLKSGNSHLNPVTILTS